MSIKIQTESKLFNNIANSLKKRSKAIKYSSTLDVKCEFDKKANCEKLSMFIGSHHDITINVWEEGEIRIYHRKIQSNKIIFELEFYGEISGLDSDDVIRLIENSDHYSYGLVL